MFSKLISKNSNYDKSNNDLSNKNYERPEYIVKYYTYKKEIKSLENKCKNNY